MRTTSILIIGLLAFIGVTQAWTGFNSVVSKLVEYQTPGGGFRGTNGKPSTEATANALLLSSLYGLRNKINTTEASKFISSVENNDGGYGPAPGSPSDIEAVRNALLALQHLGGKPKNPTKVLDYIKSLIDDSNHLFAVRVGEKGSVKGTALALESVDLLGELNQKWVQDALPKIKAELNKHRSTGDVLYFRFPTSKLQSQITTNYYGLIVAKYVGLDLGDLSKWAKYITSLQSPEGQFYDNTEKKLTSLASTANAIYSLNLLGGVKGATERFVDSVNVDNLKKGVRHIADDVSAAAHAHGALALTKAFKDFFKAAVNYEGTDSTSENILEGTNFKPSLSISSLFGDVSLPHGDFAVSSSTAFHGKDASKGKLTWDQELQRYVGEHLPTVGNLGPVKTVFNLVHKVVGLGELVFDIAETKTIGYGITVVPKANQDGREIRQGETISAGADFQFSVALNTRSSDNLVTGDFTVTFSVLDSSNVVIHQKTLSGAGNKEPISFTYRFDSAAVPPGQVSFRFEVAGKGAAHTTRTVTYQYAAPLIASNIQINSAAASRPTTHKLKEKVTVTIEPAAFPDLRTPQPLSPKDATGNDVSDKRHFVLDLLSPHGVLVKSIPSTPVKGSSKYNFEVTIEPTLDFIGTKTLSFRYVPAVGEEVHLQNYDSSTSELYDDTNALSFKVNADLSLSDITESPKAGNVFYGGNVGYKFRLKDIVSGQPVSVGTHGGVFLDLTHEEGGRKYTSVHHPAVQSDKGISVDWIINPNAIKGAGSLGLTVLDVDGTVITTKDSKSVNVNIGGDIDVEPHVYTTGITTARHTAIVAEFGLSTRNKTLKDADLLASVTRGDVIIATVPVAHHNGRYTVSWVAPHKLVPSGDYKVLFYRSVDKTRSLEKKEQREKEERKKAQLRGEGAGAATTVEEEKLVPLFTIDVSYSAPIITSLPLRAEFLTLASLAGFMAWLTFKKNNPQ